MHKNEINKVPYNPDLYPEFSYRKIDIQISEDSPSGEGVWCLLSKEDVYKYEDDTCLDTSWVILCNDSIFYKGLLAGMVIPIKFNGDSRAVVILNWLKERFEIRTTSS